MPATRAEAAVPSAFESAPLLVERLLASGPLATPDDAVARAGAILDAMSEEERVAVLNAHPRIGADPGTLSAASSREQGSDAEPAVLRELDRLNDEYERRFGFRFVVFVGGRPKSAILPVLRARLLRSRADELRAGIDEFLAIARDRMRA